MARHGPKSEYGEKLLHPKWQEKRLRVFERDSFTCQSCGSGRDEGRTLNVHHRWYGDGEPWDVPMEALVTLCAICHETETFERASEEQELLAFMRRYFLRDDIAMLNEAFYNVRSSLPIPPKKMREIFYHIIINENFAAVALAAHQKWEKDVEEEVEKYLAECLVAPEDTVDAS